MIAEYGFWPVAGLVLTGLMDLGILIAGVQESLEKRAWWSRRFTVACEPIHEGGEWQYLHRAASGRYEWCMDEAKATAFLWCDFRAHLWAGISASGQGRTTWRQWS